MSSLKFFICSGFQVLDRGEKIELLVDKTENLRSQVSYRTNFTSKISLTVGFKLSV